MLYDINWIKNYIFYNLFNKNIRAMQSSLNFGELIDYTLEWIWLIKETKLKFKNELYTLVKIMIFHFKYTLMIIYINILIKLMKKKCLLIENSKSFPQF